MQSLHVRPSAKTTQNLHTYSWIVGVCSTKGTPRPHLRRQGKAVALNEKMKNQAGWKTATEQVVYSKGPQLEGGAGTRTGSSRATTGTTGREAGEPKGCVPGIDLGKFSSCLWGSNIDRGQGHGLGEAVPGQGKRRQDDVSGKSPKVSICALLPYILGERRREGGRTGGQLPEVTLTGRDT